MTSPPVGPKQTNPKQLSGQCSLFVLAGYQVHLVQSWTTL